MQAFRGRPAAAPLKHCHCGGRDASRRLSVPSGHGPIEVLHWRSYWALGRPPSAPFGAAPLRRPAARPSRAPSVHGRRAAHVRAAVGGRWALGLNAVILPGIAAAAAAAGARAAFAMPVQCLPPAVIGRGAVARPCRRPPAEFDGRPPRRRSRRQAPPAARLHGPLPRPTRGGGLRPQLALAGRRPPPPARLPPVGFYGGPPPACQCRPSAAARPRPH